MHTLKIPSLCLLLFLLFSAEKCQQANGGTSNNASEEPEDLALISATSMNWVAGIKDGGSGTEYNFTVVVGTDQPVTISSVQINGTEREHNVHKQGAAVANSPLQIAQHDTLNVHVSTETNKEAASALITYTVGGQEMQLPVDSIEMLETQNRP